MKHNFEQMHTQETEPTSAEQVIFEELQEIARANFSEGAAMREDGEALTTFITSGRAKITEFLQKKKAEETVGMSEEEKELYDQKQKDILLKFEYLFLYPDTEATFNEIKESSF
ncbi:MAG: hypothetical protein MRY57_00705 [Candidatus Pacebacteria bacterium]|nr:hypothetical protein [Candidatus Paceibacterota bacterium]